MDKRLVYQTGAFAALIALAGALAQAAAVFSAPAGVQLQPSAPLPPAEFMLASSQYAQTTLAFFTADTIFIFGYMIVFAGLYAVTAPRARVIALLALGAGLATGLFDHVENGFFITYAQSYQAGVPILEPDSPTLHLITHLKWIGAFTALLAYGLIFPRELWRERLIVALMLLFPLVGALGIALPELVPVRGLFFLIGMPLFAFDFWMRSRAEPPGAANS
jgi:hypothetical protein